MKLDSHESSDNKVVSNLFAEVFTSTNSPSTFHANNQNYIAEEKNFDVSFQIYTTIKIFACCRS